MDKHDQAIKRIRDIRRRIEEIRNTLHSTQRVQRQSEVGKDKPPVVETQAASEKRNSDLEDLKRKLTGRTQ